MKETICSYTYFVICLLLLLVTGLHALDPNDNIKGKNAFSLGQFNQEDDDESGRLYTMANLTVKSFEEGGPSECDGKYHSNKALVVGLSTRWYKGGSRCLKYIDIFGNGIGNYSVRARVVDECDSNAGCGRKIVEASNAVWRALGVAESSNDYGKMSIYWSDA